MKLPFTSHLSKNCQFTSRNLKKFLLTHSTTSKSLTWNSNNFIEAFPQRTRQVISTLKIQHSLTELHLQLDCQKIFETNLLLFNLKNLPSLITLELNFNLKPPLSLQGLKVLIFNLPSLKNLTTLTLVFNRSRFLHLKFLQKLLQSISSLKNLTTFSLKFTFSSTMSDPYLDQITSYIPRLTHLQSFHLSFDYATKLTNSSINQLALALKKLFSLTKIHIMFSGQNNIQSSTILQFFSSFNAIKYLTDITLDVNNCKILGDTLSEPLSQCLLDLNPSIISRLSLHLYTDYKDSDLLLLAKSLSSFPSLRNLGISFYSSLHMTPENINKFLSQIQIFSCLESLQLSFNFFKNPSFIVYHVSSALKRLKNIINLKLDFSYIKLVNDEDIIQLSETLAPLTTLKYLDINLVEAMALTDNSIKCLAKSLGGLTGLKSLILNLNRVKVITNEGILALVRAVKNLKNLLCLGLGFANNEQINKECLEELVVALEGLEKLVSIDLSFFKCQQLTTPSEMYEGLMEVVKRENIQEISLVVPYLKFIFDEVEQIRKRKNIKIGWCKNSDLE